MLIQCWMKPLKSILDNMWVAKIDLKASNPAWTTHPSGNHLPPPVFIADWKLAGDESNKFFLILTTIESFSPSMATPSFSCTEGASNYAPGPLRMFVQVFSSNTMKGCVSLSFHLQEMPLIIQLTRLFGPMRLERPPSKDRRRIWKVGRINTSTPVEAHRHHNGSPSSSNTDQKRNNKSEVQ